MRFWCCIVISFFLHLKNSEAATQASCTTRIKEWRFMNRQTKWTKTCDLDIDVVDDEDFTISSSVDPLTLGFKLNFKLDVKFLPTNVFRVFPDLFAFEAWSCSITTVKKNHFRNLSKLEVVDLSNNKIEHVAKDAFVDLVSLELLYLNGNKMQSLSANWFSSLKSLKWLRLNDNKITHLDPDVFKVLVKIEYIDLSENLIATLDERIFENLTNLKQIFLSKNKLREIPGNLFQNNLKLEDIWLRENKIEFIDANMFDHLLDLRWIYLEGNVCVDNEYQKINFDAMRSDLEQNCKTSSAASSEGKEKESELNETSSIDPSGVPSHASGLSGLVRVRIFPHNTLLRIVTLMLTIIQGCIKFLLLEP